MRRPRRLGLVLGVTLGGVALGTLLGAAANPTMKNLPEPAWPAVGQATDQALEGVAVYELSPYRDRYPPAFADEAIADWAPDYPDWTYADFGSDFGDEPAAPQPDDREAGPEPQPPAASEPLPPEPRGEGSLDALY